MIRLLLFTLASCLVASLVAASAGEQPVGSTFQDRFIHRFNALEGSKETRLRDKELNRILSDFYDATLRVAENDKKARFVVLDESGAELKDVKVEIVQTHMVGLLDMKLVVEPEDRVVSGPFAVEWPREESSIDLKFHKQGHRSVSVGFSRRNAPLETRMDNLRRELLRGILNEPLKMGEPMRVLMPPNLIWPPDTKYRSDRDQVLAAFAKDQPELVRHAEGVVASTDGPVCYMTTRRGTYMCRDKMGRIVTARRFDRGALLVVERVITDTGEPKILIEHPGGDSRLKIAAGTEPYQWQFYAEPIPATLPSTD